MLCITINQTNPSNYDENTTIEYMHINGNKAMKKFNKTRHTTSLNRIQKN